MSKIDRRSFLRRSSVAAAVPLIAGAAPATPVTLVLDGNDAIASARPVLRAAHALQQALTKAGYTVQRAQTPAQANGLCIMAAGATFPAAAGALARARVVQPTAPESLALFETTLASKAAVVACGADARGLSYALYELADRVQTGATLKFPKPIVEQPANAVRSVMRQFTCEAYDKPWLWDRAEWAAYIQMLAANRFNRLDLTFGLNYDHLVNVIDTYLLFTYPFFLAVPGYDVRVTNLTDAERNKNLATLRYISDLAASYGVDFQLGLWTHGYEMKNSPDAKYIVTGLTSENHAAYCRDAITALLKQLPAVTSIGLRVHGESGIPEGSYDFWKSVFAGIAASGRKIELDLHAKGTDEELIGDALAVGLPVCLAPKYSAEHFGLPYHQADIRPTEIVIDADIKPEMKLSNGNRKFTRYGNGDLLREDRKYAVRTRVWYGTQRILASGSAEAAAAYGRAFQFCGINGFDLMEPLSYRGRRGTAVAGIRRSGYLPVQMEPQYDWQKYDYWYRSFGRMTYNPDTDVETVKRSFGKTAKTRALEAALAAGSRILPVVTQVSSVSAACDFYSPELNGTMALSHEGEPPVMFFDTPLPRNFQHVTPLDPQLFTTCAQCADELTGEKSAKYSPLEGARWLDGFASEVETNLKAAGTPAAIDAARIAIDAEILGLLGRFYAAKLRAGVLMALHEKNGERNTLSATIAEYKKARDFWAKIVERAHGVYAADLSISDRPFEQGQWADKLPDIDADIAALEARLAGVTVVANEPAGVAAVFQTRARDPLPVMHTAPTKFTRGEPVVLVAAVREGLTKATLWYRHVTAAERWTAVEMAATADGWKAEIPVAYTDSPYPLQYYFEFRASPERAWLHPGFDDKLLNQPYVVVRSV